ncbi:unnamed protein product [Moneuplotes crassus]|uniref:Uncharacterized protein n=1 Tax=Euplotes crassus TaxID=5936 RepID=A0AAD1URS0_EUPCR|nr:unnamed protein product [Moneuplotes crassus]
MPPVLGKTPKNVPKINKKSQKIVEKMGNRYKGYMNSHPSTHSTETPNTSRPTSHKPIEETLKPSINKNSKIKRNIRDISKRKYPSTAHSQLNLPSKVLPREESKLSAYFHKHLAVQAEKETKLVEEMERLKKKRYRSFKSERLVKGRMKERVEERLLREGRLRDQRREMMAEEGRRTERGKRDVIEGDRKKQEGRKVFNSDFDEKVLKNDQKCEMSAGKDENIPSLASYHTEPMNYHSNATLSPSSEKPLTLSQIENSAKRNKICTKYLTAKRNEFQKLSPRLPTALDFRKGFACKYFTQTDQLSTQNKQSFGGTSLVSQAETSLKAISQLECQNPLSPINHSSEEPERYRAKHNKSVDDANAAIMACSPHHDSTSVYYQSLFSKVEKKANLGKHKQSRAQLPKTIVSPKESRQNSRFQARKCANQTVDIKSGIGSAKNFPPDLFCHPLYARRNKDESSEGTQNITCDEYQIYYTFHEPDSKKPLIDPKYEASISNVHLRNQDSAGESFPYIQTDYQNLHGKTLKEKMGDSIVVISKGCLNTFTSKTQRAKGLEPDLKSEMITQILENDQFRTSKHSSLNQKNGPKTANDQFFVKKVSQNRPRSKQSVVNETNSRKSATGTQAREAQKSYLLDNTAGAVPKRTSSRTGSGEMRGILPKILHNSKHTDDFMTRNKRWVEQKKKKQRETKEIQDKKKLQECTFKPKTLAKEYMNRKKTEKLRSRVSRSLSPQKIKISDQFDLSVLKKARMRVEHADQEDRLIGQASPKNIPPSEVKESQGESCASDKGNPTDEKLNEAKQLQSEAKRDIVTLNLSQSPRIQHRILSKPDTTEFFKEEPTQRQKLGELPSAKRLIFNPKNEEAKETTENDQNFNEENFESLIVEKENKTPNHNLVDNRQRTAIFSEHPVRKESSPFALSMADSGQSSPMDYEVKEEVVEIEADDSGFDDFDEFEQTDNQKDFEEYKIEDFNSYLNLENDEDSFSVESELSIPVENADTHF